MCTHNTGTYTLQIKIDLKQLSQKNCQDYTACVSALAHKFMYTSGQNIMSAHIYIYTHMKAHICEIKLTKLILNVLKRNPYKSH